MVESVAATGTAVIATRIGIGGAAVTFTSTVAVPVMVPFATVTFAMKMPDAGYTHDVVIAAVGLVGGVLVPQSHVQDAGGSAPLTRVTVAVSVVEFPAAIVAGDAATATV